MKLGSLFDGSGGFPLAGILYGIEPVWASEVEPYPIAVTKEKFPKMKHLGDINTINGGMIEPVDVITFGSPCQDLSVAGRRAGLVGDRSGLFMQAIRIIKEMRDATNGLYPRFAIWENVPGAFSSNNGEDFRIVLEQFIKIKEPEAPTLPMPEKNKWAYAVCIPVILDDQGGSCINVRTNGIAPTIRAEMHGNVPCVMEAAGFKAGQSMAGGIGYQEGCAATLSAQASGTEPTVCIKAYSVENHPADSRVNIDESGKCQTLTSRMGTGGGECTIVAYASLHILPPRECNR